MLLAARGPKNKPYLVLWRLWCARLNELREPIVITQRGAAKAVLQDVATYEQTQETLALRLLTAA